MSTAAHRISQTSAAIREQRRRDGRTHRNHLNRTRLGDLHLKKRSDPIETLLSARKSRVPALLALKYARMSATPFTFFRGAVPIMAADLAREPHTGLLVQLCGDAHLQNLGCFEAPDGRLIFDINDFDETIRGPWEWDVKRMAASIVLAGMDAGQRRSTCAAAVDAFAATYCASLCRLAEQPILVAARHQIHRMRQAQAVSAAFDHAQRANPCDLLKKYTENTSRGPVRFRKIDHVIWRLHGQRRQEILASLLLYRQSLPPERLHLFDFFRPLDVAFKVVGTGSVGLRDYVVLMEGSGAEDPLFLQLKQEVRSAYTPYIKSDLYPNEGQRVVVGQHKIQPLSDLLLGWTRIGEHDYLVRQLNDHKGTVDLRQLRGEGLRSLATIAGELLARGHARSGDALMIKGYVGAPDKVVKSIVHYGLEYASLTEADFEIFKKAISYGRIKTAVPS
ncbi:MAG: DUF2252 domain-containing protein [Acidobacteriaceae bacterium]|nr:DUF2252 domain-containing protein [Acidobacteriaceae bacterium]MBV9780752.1 DUF2252 domain-containing protein [Acidobacteriaceae bacterium]